MHAVNNYTVAACKESGIRLIVSETGRKGTEEEPMKPVVLVTRKLPDAVEDRLRRDYDVRLNPEDVLYSSDELIERAKDVDAILPCHTEKFTAEVIARLPENVRAIANFSVGYDHVDLQAAKARGRRRGAARRSASRRPSG